MKSESGTFPNTEEIFQIPSQQTEADRSADKLWRANVYKVM